MKKYLLLAGIFVLLAFVVSVLLHFVRASNAHDVSSLIYESSYGYRIVMDKQQDGILFSYIPSAEQAAVEQLRGEESYETVQELLRESGLDSAVATLKNSSEEDADRLTIVCKNGRKRVLTRPESDDAFQSIRSCLMEFAGFCR